MSSDKPKLFYLTSCALICALSLFNAGYCYGYFNNLTGIMHKQYVYRDKQRISDEDLFNSLVSGLMIVGAIPGSLIATPMMKKGRRITLIISSLIHTLGACLCLIFNMWALLIGRFIMGIAIGIYFSVCPLYISEMSPPSVSGPLGTLNQMSLVTGLFLAYAFGYILPLSEDSDAATTGLWRVVSFPPIVFGLIQFLFLTMIFRYDTPRFYKNKGDIKNYHKIMNLIFYDAPTQEDKALDSEHGHAQKKNIQENENQIDKNSGDEKSLQEQPDKEQEVVEESKAEICPPGVKDERVDDTTKQAKDQKIEGDKNESIEVKTQNKQWTSYYKKALLYCSLLSFFQQASGVNGVTFFSNEIFKDGDEGNAAERRARLGTLLIGVAAFTGTNSSIWLYKYFSRKFFFLTSEIIILVCLSLCGICALVDFDVGVIVLTMIYIYAFNCGIGPTLWIYSSDVLDSSGTSLIALINMVMTVIFAGTTNLMFEYFTAPGVYFGLSVIQIFCILFIWKFIRETKGKSREECERLYQD
ncbi:unnamed protein product [Moneuplotes crassus]|uniref:Hexose transporter 1 n=1 Tax=Euplotes crassus TaxID=5936 RepID=A0AAD1XB99_EUPCR|nr:unnamed protein product [Moneuplotes crassus]